MPANKVIEGQTARATDFNALVDDVQDVNAGHDHSGDEGAGRKVTHADLLGATDEAENGHTHAEVDAHLDAEEAHRNASSNVHGLGNAMIHVLGYPTANKAFCCGVYPGSTVPVTIWPLRSDNEAMFSTIDGVIVSCSKTTDDPADTGGYPVAFAYPDGTDLRRFIMQANCTVSVFWLAWGTPAVVA